MKNKGVVITIMLILVLGAGITVRTRQFVKENASASSFSRGAGQLSENEMVAGESLPLSAAAGFQASAGMQDGQERPGEEAPLTEAGSDGAARGYMDEAGGAPAAAAPQAADVPVLEDIQENAVSEDISPDRKNTGDLAAASPEGDVSSHEMEEAGSDGSVSAGKAAPVETAVLDDSSEVASPITHSSGDPANLVEILTREEYGKKLAEVDSLVEGMKENNVSASTDSLKNIADYEYRLWDTELNSIYQAVMSGMDEEEAEKLRAEEREWIRKRDSDAKKAASKYKGGTMENLEYVFSLAGSTRSRAYEILEQYGEYLPE